MLNLINRGYKRKIKWRFCRWNFKVNIIYKWRVGGEEKIVRIVKKVGRGKFCRLL